MVDGQFEQLFSYDPAVIAGGSAVFDNNPESDVTIQGFPTIHTTRNAFLSSQKISSNNPTNFLLHRFSITYLHFSENAPAVTPSAATVCSGNSVTLSATGGCFYEWTVSPSNYTLDESVGNIISVHPETTGTYTFTVIVKNKNGNPVPGSPQTAIVTVAATPTPFTVSAAPNGCNIELTASQSANSYTWFPADGLSATTGHSVTADFSSDPRTYIVTASNGSCKYAQPVTASQILNTGNQLAIPHRKRAYVAGCANELHFKNDEADQNAIYGIPIGGYIEVDKYDEDGNFVSSDVIDASELASGTEVPCDVAGKYILRYNYALPGCIEHVLEQTAFVLGVKATAIFAEICPEFALQIAADEKDSWSQFFWEPAASWLFEDKNGNNPIDQGISYDKVYFINPTPGTYTVTVSGLQGGNECSIHDYIVTVSDQCCTTGGVYSDLTFSANKFENTNYGITSNLDLYSTLSITANEITINSVTSGQAYSGISISDFTGSDSLPHISGNTISNGRYGIYLLNTAGDALVEDNTINITGTAAHEGAVYGIYTEAGNGTQIQRNTITGNSAVYNNFYRKSAISLYQSQNCQVTCNKAIKVGHGFYFKGNCGNTLFRGNEMGVSGDNTKGNFYGIYREYFDESDLIGNQGDAGNSHSNYAYGPFENANDWCTYHLNTVNGANFYFNPNDPSYLQSFTQGGNLESFFFQFTPSASAQLFDCPQFVLRDESDNIDSSTDSIEGISSIIGANEVEEWMNNRVLFEQLTMDSTQIEELGFETFYDTTLQTGIAALAAFTIALQTDSAFSNEQNIEAITNINNEVPEELYWEANEKKLNEIFLSTVAIGIDTFTEDQESFISAMALSCPSVDGFAVFKARSLYAILVYSIVYFDDSLCSAISQKRSVSETEDTLICYPNPTSNFTLIGIGQPLDGQQELIVYDYIGQERIRIMLPPRIRFYSLHFDQATQGIYHIQLLRGNVSGATCTLVLIQ
jgi:parallel beta-helix repeat protein